MSRFIKPLRRDLLIAAFLVAAAPALAEPSFEITALRAEIASNGARAAIARLNHAHPDAKGRNAWSRLIERMSQGDRAVIALAPLLAKGTDAGTSEDLGIALTSALPMAPDAVLQNLSSDRQGVLGVARVCGVPFIEER